MELLRVAGATLNQTALDFAGNVARIRAVLAEARQLGVELLCLPELSITGYGCEDAFFSLSTAKAAEAALADLLPATAGMTVVFGLPHFYYGAMYNCAVMVQDGTILGMNAKRVLPREGVHYEPRWFRPWPFGKVAETELLGQRVPLGDLRYRLGSLGVAVEICEEAWDSVPASAAHADAVDLIVNPSASHFALGKYQKREHLVANSSRSMQVIYLYTNLLGCEAGRIVYDGGVLFAEGGEIVARGPRFGFGDGTVVYRDVNPDLARLAKLKVKPVREPVADQRDSRRAAGELPSAEIIGRDPRAGRHEEHRQALGVKRLGVGAGHAYAPLTREEEFLHAEMLGLFDYLRKSGAKGYVVPLSGGCDSSAVTALIAHMVAEALKELGYEAFNKRLRLNPPLVGDDVRAATHHVLTCIYQRSKNSSETTENAALGLASAVGANWHVTDVSAAIDNYTKATEAMLGRQLTWERDDLTLQNIQARARAPLAWMMANALQAILITTSNRSEAAVGYATMDGDMAGGLAPLSGIDKHFLRHWLVWAEHKCHHGIGPIAALRAVNTQAPTAELRPQSSSGVAQTDEADLMPYSVLERIERYLVRDRLGADDILAMLKYDFADRNEVELREYLDKFLRLWAQNQWKRERMAPGFQLDDLSLDPKTWCRYPILSAPMRTTGP